MPTVAELQAVLSAPTDQIRGQLASARAELQTTATTATSAGAAVTRAFQNSGTGFQAATGGATALRTQLQTLQTQLTTLAGQPHSVQVDAQIAGAQAKLTGL